MYGSLTYVHGQIKSKRMFFKIFSILITFIFMRGQLVPNFVCNICVNYNTNSTLTCIEINLCPKICIYLSHSCKVKKKVKELKGHKGQIMLPQEFRTVGATSCRGVVWQFGTRGIEV